MLFLVLVAIITDDLTILNEKNLSQQLCRSVVRVQLYASTICSSAIVPSENVTECSLLGQIKSRSFSVMLTIASDRVTIILIRQNDGS